MDAKISLEQWRALLAVIDSGGYAKAAEALGKSQSAVTYAIQQLETQLEIKVFELQGRRAMPTPAGQLLHRRARALLDEAAALEQAARRLSAGVEAEVRIAAELMLPAALILDCLGRVTREFAETRIELVESVLSGTEDAILQRDVDLALTSRVPPGFLGEPLLAMRFCAVAHAEHPLLQLERELTGEDLRRHRQIIVRDSGAYRRRNEGWLGSEQRWTVSHMVTSVQAVRRGLGFAWLPIAYIHDDLRSGVLRPLPLREGGEREVQTFLVFVDRDGAGPATRRLAEVFREVLPSSCTLASA